MIADPHDGVPPHLDDEAPTPAEADGDEVDAVATIEGRRYGAADFQGARYCIDCANRDYVEFGHHHPRAIPYGGPVEEGGETDCPGHGCDHCHRLITSLDVIHYAGTCQPQTCKRMTAHILLGDTVTEVAVLSHIDGLVEAVLRETVNRRHTKGDLVTVHESRLRTPVPE